MRVEINLTLACNAACPDCNRLCHLMPSRSEHVSLESLKSFVRQAADRPGLVRRVKIAGGEPLMHPHFAEAMDLVASAVRAGVFEAAKLDTNGILPVPPGSWRKFIPVGGRRPPAKSHLPALWSPSDMGLSSTPCSMPFRCGLSLDPRGWLPCSGAVAIARTFRFEHLYKTSLPGSVWGLDELCPHCAFSAPEAWRKEHCVPLSMIPAGGRPPTPSWAAAMRLVGL